MVSFPRVSVGFPVGGAEHPLGRSVGGAAPCRGMLAGCPGRLRSLLGVMPVLLDSESVSIALSRELFIEVSWRGTAVGVLSRSGGAMGFWCLGCELTNGVTGGVGGGARRS